MTDCKKPTSGFWITVALVGVLAAYPLSFGPAVWLTGRRYFRESTVTSFYWPVLWSTAHAQALEKAVDWWGSLWVPNGESVTLMIRTDEADIVFQFGDSSATDPFGIL